MNFIRKKSDFVPGSGGFVLTYELIISCGGGICRLLS